MGWRIAEEDEVEGIDFAEHGESAYDLTSTGGARRSGVLPTAAPGTPAATTKEGASA
jgi:Amt family ammonium transporter